MGFVHVLGDFRSLMTRTNEKQDESPGHPDTPIGVCPGLSGFVEFALSVKVRICPAVRVGCPGCFSYQTAAIVASAQDWSKAQAYGGNRKSDQAVTLPLDTVADRAAQSGAQDWSLAQMVGKPKSGNVTGLATVAERSAQSAVSNCATLRNWGFPPARSAEVAKVQSCTVAVLCFPTICVVISGAADCDDTKPRDCKRYSLDFPPHGLLARAISLGIEKLRV